MIAYFHPLTRAHIHTRTISHTHTHTHTHMHTHTHNITHTHTHTHTLHEHMLANVRICATIAISLFYSRLSRGAEMHKRLHTRIYTYVLRAHVHWHAGYFARVLMATVFMCAGGREKDRKRTRKAAHLTASPWSAAVQHDDRAAHGHRSSQDSRSVTRSRWSASRAV